MPAPYLPLFHANFFKWPVFMLSALELNDLPFSCPNNEGAVPVAQWNQTQATPAECVGDPAAAAAGCYAYYCPLKNGNQMLSDFDISYGDRWFYFAVHLGMQPLLRLATFVVMRYVNHVKR